MKENHEEKMSKALKEATGVEPDITLELVKHLQEKCYNLKNIDSNQLMKGIEVELEHYDTVGGDMEIIANIAADHIKEFPNYYHELKEMEDELEKEDEPIETSEEDAEEDNKEEKEGK